MHNIHGLTLEELKEALIDWNQPVFHTKQIFTWIYQKGVMDFEEMSNLSVKLRKQLKENFSLSNLKLLKSVLSKDGTEKFLFGLRDNHCIEAVVIPTQKRTTVCLSTQVGCKFACRFCASGLLGFKRNLTSAEMIEQLLSLKNNSQNKKITHLVFMGIGEPLDNYDNLLAAIRMINSPSAFNLGARRITISTCGIIPAIKRLSEEGLQIELSISLHAADERTRSQIMPINKIYPLSNLISACRQYIQKTKRQLTFEYVLLKDVNSVLQNAQKLSKILRGLNCKINLIPCNSIRELNPVRNTNLSNMKSKISNGVKVGPPNKLEILLFRDYLLKQGIDVTLRRPRGQDIEAACGQLRLRYEKK